MQYKKRKTNGQFRSKRNSERLFTFHISLVVLLLTSPFAVGFAVKEDVIEWSRPHVQKAEASTTPEVLEIIEIVPTPVEKAIKEIPHESKITTDVIAYLYKRADEAGLDGDKIAHTIYCESMFYSIQSGIVKNGVQEPSYGIAQIHIPSHPDVTVEEAMNPYFAVDFIINHWADDAGQGIWHGYNRTNDECTNTIVEYWK